MITVTENAAQKAIGLIEREGRSSDEGFGLRMKVVGGGVPASNTTLHLANPKVTTRSLSFTD